MGACPEELTGDGRELWIDAVAFLAANGKRTGLSASAAAVVPGVWSDSTADASGVKALEATRRWLSECN
jgi:hypothetical protein